MRIDYKFLIEKIKFCGEISKKTLLSDKEIKFERKEDGSKVTQTDKEISDYLEKELFKEYSNIKFFSEENSKNLINLPDEKNFFLVDPIDGTNSFIKKEREFTINLSYISNEKLIFSCIFSPMKNTLYYSDEKNSYKIFENKITRLNNKNNNLLNCYRVIATRRQEELRKVNETLKKNKIKYELNYVASAIKFCILADGDADLYIRRANIKLWDVIAGFHITNNANFFIKDSIGNNILEYLLSKEYLKKIQKKEFRICEFLIQSTDKIKFIF
tara:strand:- start:1567 stop:2382 length:816 start_codon:yes stop_codon:yes gene_type:complete